MSYPLERACFVRTKTTYDLLPIIEANTVQFSQYLHKLMYPFCIKDSLLVANNTAVNTNIQTRRLNHCPPPAAVTNHLLLHWCLLFAVFFFCFFFIFFLFFPFPVFLVIMTSRCFNFRFAYPLPLLPHLHTARMASGHPTDKFSFMYQPDTHKRYGARMHTHSHTNAHTYTHSFPMPIFPMSR